MERRKGFNLRIYFIALVFAILSVSLVVSGAFSYLLDITLAQESSFSLVVWLLLFSIVLSTIITSITSKWILSPITKLSKAMNHVAAGDFSVRLKTNSNIAEISKTYGDFNVMAQELNATEMLQSDFVSNVSHEIKTPINAIEGYAMLLQEGQLPYEEQSEYVGKILVNTRRLSELVNNILLISKVDNQAIQVDKKQRFRLDEQIRQALLALEPKWTEKGTEFDVEMEQISYCGNESLMYHVWINLIDNAVKFGPYGGMVKIRLMKREGQIQFEIEDNGPGIPENMQRHIFDKFFQADSSHKTEGNGLGLALVKRILDASGGRVTVQSLPDRGCKFTVLLS